MECTAEADRWTPRSRSSRAARTLPISGRSLARASAAFLAFLTALDMAPNDTLVAVAVPFVSPVDVALEAVGELDAARSLVPRVRRIRTQRSRSSGERRAGGWSGAKSRGRRIAALHPADQRRESVEAAGARPAAAVVDARQHEQARE